MSDTPGSVLAQARRGFGRLRVLLLWLHAFEEPFYSYKSFEELARPTAFREGRARFVSVLCCLTLVKES